MKYPGFVGPAYLSRSLNMNCQRAVNLYPEVDETSKHVIGLYGTPGLTLKVTAGSGPIRGLYAGETYLYAVSGNEVYYIDTAWTATALSGTLARSTGTVSIDENASQLVLVDGTDGYTVTLPTGAVTTIGDADFPATPSRVAVCDGYAITDNVGTGKFYISSINDATAWDGLDFATAEGMPDDIVSILVDHREAWLFGARSTEVWENSGNADFPWTRISFIEQGCAAKHAVCKADNGVYWIASSDRGDSTIFRATGYQPTVISTPAIEFAISNYTTISDAIAWAYEEEGHVFIVFTFPTGNATWVYDVAMSTRAGRPIWHERAYMIQATSVLQRHRANAHAFFNRAHVVGDYQNGKIYQQDLDVYADNSDYIKRLRAAPTGIDNRVYEASMTDPVKCVWTGANLRVTKGKDRMFHHRFQLTLESGVGLVSGQGSDPQIMLRYSNDNGHTWSDELWGSAGLYTGGGGNLGEFARRYIQRRLGSAPMEE